MLLHAVSLLWFLTHDLLHPLTGPSSAAQGGYLFWSGIAGSFLIGGGIWSHFLHQYARHNCHVRWCPRIGKHPAAGGKYTVCAKHHPHVDGKPTAADVHADHSAWLNGGVE